MIEVRLPAHLMLPKGKKTGMPYVMFMMITPRTGEMKTMDWDRTVVDTLPMGYPFDRQLHLEEWWQIPNMMEKEVLIFHKKTDETHEFI